MLKKDILELLNSRIEYVSGINSANADDPSTFIRTGIELLILNQFRVGVKKERAFNIKADVGQFADAFLGDIQDICNNLTDHAIMLVKEKSEDGLQLLSEEMSKSRKKKNKN